METNEELETELKAVDAKIDAQYWKFSRTSSSSVKLADQSLYAKKAELTAELKARKSDGVVITRPVLATESKIEEAVVASAKKTMKRMAKYGWTFERAYAHANLSRHLFKFVK